MAGRIKREDVALVRERASIEEVVGAHVTLKGAGVGSMKGLCPFHDERSPSFHVRPQVGLWHCFGCGEGGDVISFVQKIDGLGFAEAVEYLAGRYNITLRYEEGGGPRSGVDVGSRRRLLEANATAAQFFLEQLESPAAAAARQFLSERGFELSQAAQFGVGFAPQGWDSLLRHLRGRGFTDAEITTAGLVSQGQRGVYDRFRGRLVWPIREVTGDVVGFGARRLFEDDQGPKYLNTPETPLYHKAQVLYGLDLAKREIAKARQVVVVEGYTDVMAAHLSGVPTAVATCGTAFGPDHVRVVRRLLGDTAVGGGVQLASGQSTGGEIIFTFDGDEAGRKAALRAFGEDQSFSAQTFVAVEPSGMDPCDLRLAKGPDAVQALVRSRVPLFEFVLKSTLAAFDLDTAEGRVGALRAAAPVVAGIRDAALRPEYARMLSGWLGMELETVRRAVANAPRGGGRVAERRPSADRPPSGPRAAAGSRGPAQRPSSGGRPGYDEPPPDPYDEPGAPPDEGEPGFALPDGRDPVVRLETQAVEILLQVPHLVPPDITHVDTDVFAVPVLRAVAEAIQAAGGLEAARVIVEGAGAAAWIESVHEQAPVALHQVITRLAVAPLPEDRVEQVPVFVRGVLGALKDLGLTRQIAQARSRLQRMDAQADPEAYQAAFAEIVRLETERRELRAD